MSSWLVGEVRDLQSKGAQVRIQAEAKSFLMVRKGRVKERVLNDERGIGRERNFFYHQFIKKLFWQLLIYS